MECAQIINFINNFGNGQMVQSGDGVFFQGSQMKLFAFTKNLITLVIYENTP